MREALGEAAPPKAVPQTIDSMRADDVTTVDADDQEVLVYLKYEFKAPFYNYISGH